MKFKDFLRKFLRKNKEQQIEEQENLNGEFKSVMKKFDIMIFEEDEGRGTIQKTENGVFASNAQQLVALYAQCGQKIRILREYPDDKVTEKPIDISPKLNDPVELSTTAPTSPSVQTITIPAVPKIVEQPKSVPEAKPTYVVKKENESPKYFSICGTECKIENGKIYQKQWVKILGTEASQYRIISDANNKEFPLKGKHIEMLKWVLIQDDNDDNDVNKSIKQILNG